MFALRSVLSGRFYHLTSNSKGSFRASVSFYLQLLRVLNQSQTYSSWPLAAIGKQIPVPKTPLSKYFKCRRFRRNSKIPVSLFVPLLFLLLVSDPARERKKSLYLEFCYHSPSILGESASSLISFDLFTNFR